MPSIMSSNIKNLQKVHFSKIFMGSDGQTYFSEELDEICLRLNPATVLNPHKSMLGTGNYDINVIMSALNSRYVHFQYFLPAKFTIL